MQPAFAFGHGLSYTRFDYADLAADPAPDGSVTVSFTVTNSGKRRGDEVVQIYVAPPPSRVPRPPLELKEFVRVPLDAAVGKRLAITLGPRAFAYWDTAANGWTVEAGSYEIRVGASSRDIRLRRAIDVKAARLSR